MAAVSNTLPLLTDYLGKLHPTDFDALYREQGCVVFVFQRLLPPLAQQYMIRVAFQQVQAGSQEPLHFQSKLFSIWTAPRAVEDGTFNEALKALAKYYILLQGEGKGLEVKWTANRHFLENLSSYLITEAPQRVSSPEEATLSALHNHAVKQWDSFLRWLTGSKDGGVVVPLAKDVVVQLSLQSHQGHLTSEGFRYVLNDRQTQLWKLVLCFLFSVKENRELHRGSLVFCINLAHKAVGDVVYRDTTSGRQTQRKGGLLEFVHFLAEIGVVKQEAKDFVMTPAGAALFSTDVAAKLARSMAGDSGSGASVSSEAEQGIVVESNFKVYAYTSGSHYVSLLKQFCRIITQLPNMVVGHLVADTVLQALAQGISIDNIIKFLETAAHPRAVKRARDGSPIVPANVKNQLEVWESSKQRAKTREAVLFEWSLDEQDADTEFAAAVAAASSLNGLIFKGKGSREKPWRVAVDANGADVVRDIIRRKRREAAERVAAEAAEAEAVAQAEAAAAAEAEAAGAASAMQNPADESVAPGPLAHEASC
uniref:General transcription factor IIH subunit 4 n=1 Tax=Crypthecodinium cohnii TaxID=2866 RepID=A0A516AGR4_CRYCO|nr:general transcription factor IIH subunit 4 [Crypthecodinium cohnii]USW07862.1 general transcription factor IIH subunit 4 [Crypthecodinium cohnii]